MRTDVPTVLHVLLIKRANSPFAPPLNWPHGAELVPSYAIGSVAMFWVIQCVAAF